MHERVPKESAAAKWGGHVRWIGKKYLLSVVLAQWRDNGKELNMPQEHAAYFAKLDYKTTKRTSLPAPRLTTTTPCRDTT